MTRALPVSAGDTVMALDPVIDMPVTCRVIAVHDDWAWIQGRDTNRLEVVSKLERIDG